MKVINITVLSMFFELFLGKLVWKCLLNLVMKRDDSISCGMLKLTLSSYEVIIVT